MSELATGKLAADLLPMEARLVEDLPAEPGWQFEPKWDGFRCLALRDGDQIELRAKSGKPLARYFPEIVMALRELEPSLFLVDGELAIPVGETLSFDALQMRLHPAESRIRKLAVETPAVLILFDMLMTPDGGKPAGNAAGAAPHSTRRLFTIARPTRGYYGFRPFTREIEEARTWLDTSGGALDGVIAKRLDGVYEPGERAMLKIKKRRTADCVVGGFRYERNTRVVGSLLLGLYNR